MKLSEFLRVYPLRAKNLMWFLGSGASAAARIPTANDLMWLLKRSIYCSEQKISPKTFEDLSDEYVRRRIQAYIDTSKRFPPAGDPDEYAALFEYAYPDPKDRRARLDSMLTGAQPSYGHNVLAALIRLELTRVVWTTNFDRVVEDAVQTLFGAELRMTVATIDSASTALRALNESSFPLLVKLHGDFLSERLKNTRAELREQEGELRNALIEGCRRYGLLVAGYSGRDRSVMEALEDAARSSSAFPAGLFWFVRSDGTVFETVENLMTVARSNGVDAHLVEVETFDELLGDTFSQLSDIPDDVAKKVGPRAERISYASMPDEAGSYPAIRMNAIPITALPTVCRLLQCQIGNAKEVEEAVQASGENVVATRRSFGVIGFGSDTAMRRTFGSYEITKFDLHQIEFRRLAFESGEFSIVSAALARAVARGSGLRLIRRRSGYRLVPENDSDERFETIKKMLQLSGLIPGTSIRAHPALDIRLDVRFDRAWLLMEPAIMFDDSTSPSDDERARNWVREKLARIYNRRHSELLDGWVKQTLGSQKELQLSALGISEGLDATFTLSLTPGFSWRRR